MLKRFFISVLGTITGIWIFIIIFFVAMMFGLVSLLTSEGSIFSSKSVLYIDLAGSIVEREYVPTVQDMVFGYETGENLSDIVTSIRLAKDDKDIKGIYINCAGSSLGVASRGEILEALADFKTSGKWVYAYSDNYTQEDYYVATGADDIYLNPVGSVDIHGMASTTMFFKNLLDKIGVKAEVVKVGDFKSAVEPYLRTDMSDSSVLQTRVFLDNIWGDVAGSIAKHQGVQVADVNMWADSISLAWSAQQYVDAKMVTALKYRSEVDDIIRGKLDLDSDDKLPTISPTDYMAEHGNKLGKSSSKHVAVLYCVGDIVDAGSGGIVGPTVVAQIQELAEDDDVSGLVLRVNSGGGSAFASEQIWHALEQFKETGKPFYVSMGDYAASGGYYISCGADRIYADANTLTGSIGIFGLLFNAEELLSDKLGINTQTVETNPGSTMLIPFGPLTERQHAAMQGYVENGYDTFVSRVAAGRHMEPAEVRRIGGGRVWDGQSALKLGLVDQLGDLNTAISAVAKKCGLDSNKYVCYPKKQLGLFGIVLDGAKAKLGVEDKYLIDAAYLREIKNMNPVQARMEPIFIQ
ncbi:MAG: signal peptide peptidase SppA [Muribaculaceae bacterium]|nr:signal peptide peptidase SppA [Muribaculaceae bacterium]